MIPPAPPQAEPARRLPDEIDRLRELFEQAPGCMVVFVGPDHVVHLANPAYLSFTGLPRDIVGQPASVGLQRGYARGFGRLLDDVYASGQSKVVRNAKLLVTRYPGGPDEEAYGDFMLQPLRDAAGATYGVICQGHEVTLDKLAADALQASREQLKAALDATRAIFDNSHDVICEIGPCGVFQQVNKHAERMWGYHPDELIGRCFADFVHPDDVAMTAEIGCQVAAGVPTKTFLNRYLHKDGTAVPVMWSAVRSDAKESIICIGRDMREHIEAEEKLRQAQKMEAVGRLTGGIAHDFNNLLTVVIGSAETLADSLGDSPELASIARMALDAAERGAELVSRLLAFARTQPLAPQPVDCAKFLEALEPILRRTLANNIEVAVEAPDGELCCLADLTQLTSAVLNLCINARDAMPDGGSLRVRVSQEDELGGQAPAFVVLSVDDTGEGMSAQTRARALEPFFTTKPVGKGSGLGLSMVHGFVSQSGGRLEIDSELGRGASVRLYLPRTAGGEAPIITETAAAMPAPYRHVLLVEDDDLLRGQVARQLALLGCEVSAHGNGHDALDRLEAGAPVDLLMTDLAMPGGLNGRQLADRARALNPALRILFTSGHTDEPTVRALRMDGRAGFLAKPYRRAELGRSIAEVFGDQPTRASAGA
jgi:PAS domain S-box-containing protein